MPALVAGIHVFLSAGKKDVDGRNKSGHDELRARFEIDAHERMALGDAIRLLLPRAGVGADEEGDGDWAAASS